MKGIIIGGGIGGLTTALALKQRGISVTVFEAAPELKPVGAGIILATNAMQVMQRLGLAEKIKENSHQLACARIADHKWKTIQQIDTDYALKKYGVGSYAIHRATLHQILFEALPLETVKLNHKVASVSQNGNKVTVKFENGKDEEADFVIGGDGIKSAVRQSLFGKTDYRYSGQTCWRGIVDFNISKELESIAYELWGSKAGLRLGIVPITKEQIYFFITICSPANGKDDPAILKENLIHHISEFGELSIKLLKATDSQKIIRTDIYDFAPIKTWHKGRVALIGDAAHATTPNLGQGGCQAVEDAYAIAKSLEEHNQPEKAFEFFQSTRYSKAKYVVDTSWLFGKLTNLSSPLLMNLRNAAIRLTPTSTARKSLDKLFALNY